MSLCLSCGLCCDGTMFREVPVTPEEARTLGARARFDRTRTRMRQPCRALEACRCQVYDERPAKCRAFSCLVLQALERGEVSAAEAHEAIADVLARRARVAALLGLAQVPGLAAERARALVSSGRASAEVTAASERLERALLLMKADGLRFARPG
jgi:hypothetical protein